MNTLHIEHPISDFYVWKAAFDRFAAVRDESGVMWHAVARPIDDDHYISIDLGFEDRTRAERFLSFLREQVWSNAQNAPALAGDPQARVLEILETQGLTQAPPGQPPPAGRTRC